VSLEALAELVSGRRVVALTGAGCSTESGIPDYRGEGTRRRARAPVEYREFLRSPAARARYWARSALGWQRFASAPPNAAHRALASLEASGQVGGVITQNVDQLHQAAGSRVVIELHGALSRVRCLDCDLVEPRQDLQARLLEQNPGFTARISVPRPDGDAEPEVAPDSFEVPACVRCGGVLKPDVVFFGESVPKSVVADAYSLLDGAEVLLVVGSSLAVFSGYRFVRAASERRLPIALVNRGESRGDAHAQVKLDALAGVALPALVEILSRAS
jgi:NAD-dependent deacetylase sirtuin 4